MVIVTQRSPAVKPADPDQVQAREGYLPGAPPGVTAETQLADARAYRRLRCGVCHARDRRCRFYHRGQSYRVVAVCRGCSHAEVV